MTSEYEDARTRLEALAEWYRRHSADRNEATTRLHLIDRLLFECLGWDKNDAVLEESQGGEFADYVLSYPRRMLIVEAKREGNYFELPAGKERVEYLLPSLMRDYKDLAGALEQAAEYCQRRGVPFGAVCNGNQLVAFLATRNDGQPPLEGRALVFPSLQFMLDHFLDLWQYLSRPGICERNIQRRLLGEAPHNLPSKFAETISDYPGVRIRNVFQTDLQILTDIILEDITRSPELETQFLGQCYCQSGALSQHSMVTKDILKARYEAMFAPKIVPPTPVPATTKHGLSPELLSDAFSRRPILLIGDVGVGKTTFIRYLMKVDAKGLFDNAIAIYVDLGTQATLRGDLKGFVLEEIEKQLKKEYKINIRSDSFVRGVYNLELETVRTGLYGRYRYKRPDLYEEKEIEFLSQKMARTEEYLGSSLGHIAKGHRKQVVLFLDNADQRDEATQNAAFLIAQEIAAHWPAMVFVTLRPETFNRSSKDGVLSGYHHKAFTISPPRLDLVIRNRLTFGLKITSGQIPITSTFSGTRVKLHALDGLIRVFLTSLEKNPELEEFIDNMSGGNIRAGLNYVAGFFRSGHVNTKKIFEIYKNQKFYYIPLHEFLRAVIYGDHKYYNPDASPIANLFDIARPDPKEHFVLPVVLRAIESAKGSASEGGFVETDALYARVQALGYTPEQIDTALIRAYRFRLIDTTGRIRPQPPMSIPHSVRVTSVGLYHIRKLIRQFQYVDAVVIDTPLLEKQVRDTILDVSYIGERLDRAEVFRQYLDRQWGPLSDTTSPFSWSVCSNQLKQQIQNIRDRVNIT